LRVVDKLQTLELGLAWGIDNMETDFKRFLKPIHYFWLRTGENLCISRRGPPDGSIDNTIFAVG